MLPSVKNAIAVGSLSVVAYLSGCAGDNGSSSSSQNVAEDFDFTAMFANYADNIIIPNYESLKSAADNLADEQGPLGQYCAGIGSANEASLFTSAELAWHEVQSSIQHSESHVLGPVADNGAALRARLSAYHVGELSACGIDQGVVLNAQSSNFDVTTRTVTQRGIGAVEYLLFNTDLTHNCPSQIAETADWDQRSTTERQTLRCDYALTLAKDIAVAADEIVTAWSMDGGNYRSEFINPLNDAENLTALSDAMFFMEIDVKDAKLGIPTGINDACSEIACPDQVESPYSQSSLANIADNLSAFQTMMTGADGLGFDDIISQAGVAPLNQQFADNIQAALASIQTQPASLYSQAAGLVTEDDETDCTNSYTNPTTTTLVPACSLFGLVKLITDDLKVGFIAAVDVDLPDRSQSDND
ncbi:imelysin family protein [Halioxenophilus aromaticivorans]|uniref:Imelysin-like domain-containing protein n=1 Tax=Halioxenophilus aromaticivorans TaxID=1306992 RepID=A0AAV3U7R6_9ALTE